MPSDACANSEIASQKIAMRKAAKAARKQAAAMHGADAAQKLAEIGIAFAGVSTPAIVSCYIPIGDEADTMGLMDRLHAQGFALSLPVIVEKGQPLEFRIWKPGEPLNEVQWGIREPGPDADQVAPDIVLSPLLAFDAKGFRLGYGGGFYDRSLQQLRADKPVISIGVAYDEQRVDCVPHDTYDQRLDWILTPSGAHKFG